MPNKPNHLERRGVSRPGNKQRNAINEEYSTAIRLFGKSFVDAHLDAIADGRSRRTLGDLIRAHNSKK